MTATAPSLRQTDAVNLAPTARHYTSPGQRPIGAQIRTRQRASPSSLRGGINTESVATSAGRALFERLWGNALGDRTTHHAQPCRGVPYNAPCSPYMRLPGVLGSPLQGFDRGGYPFLGRCPRLTIAVPLWGVNPVACSRYCHSPMYRHHFAPPEIQKS